MNVRFAIAFLLAYLFAGNVSAQKKYPQQYFSNPLNIPIVLAGNFGECRPGHFHSGLDIKTQGRENLPVYAAAGGYVSRIKMEPGGFGHALYITHPNGYTTLYAHLNDFSKEIQEFVHREQYTRKSWELDIQVPPGKFPVKKGDFIARSGNTGGSSAPHLHFEIRDTQSEHPLNPQLFGFNLEDSREAVPTELAFYDADKSIYEQTAQRVTLQKSGSLFTAKSTIRIPYKRCLIGIAVNDYMNGSENTLSFYQIEWYWNDSLAGTLTLDDIGYEETRYLNACADYALHFETGTWYNSLFVTKGNKLERLYQINIPALELQDSNSLRIRILDNSGNVSTVQTSVFAAARSADTAICSTIWTPADSKRFTASGISAEFQAGTIYDDVCFYYEKRELRKSISALHRVHHAKVPVHKAFQLSLQADKAVPFSLRNKVCMRYSDGKDSSGKAAIFAEQRYYQASFRNFGNFWLETDTTAPLIRLVRQTKSEIRLQISDRLTSVANVRGQLKSNGQWLCFERHGKEWFYVFDEYLPAKGSSVIVVEAEDENGNKSRKEFPIRR